LCLHVELKLLGFTALFLACKYEEDTPLEVRIPMACFVLLFLKKKKSGSEANYWMELICRSVVIFGQHGGSCSYMMGQARTEFDNHNTLSFHPPLPQSLY
jgi:hypothetical protein